MYLSFVSVDGRAVVVQCERVTDVRGRVLYDVHGDVRSAFPFERPTETLSEANLWCAAELERRAGELMARASACRLAATLEATPCAETSG